MMTILLRWYSKRELKLQHRRIVLICTFNCWHLICWRDFSALLAWLWPIWDSVWRLNILSNSFFSKLILNCGTYIQFLRFWTRKIDLNWFFCWFFVFPILAIIAIQWKSRFLQWFIGSFFFRPINCWTSLTKSAGRFSRHATLISLIKQTLGCLGLPSMLEPRGLYRTDGKQRCVRRILLHIA